MLTTLEPLTTPARLSDIVFDRIKNAIIAGTLAPGSAIKDAELAQQLGVSRMPIREALQRLARIGLVEVAASRFTRVTRVTPDLVRETLDFAQCHAVAVVGLAVPRLTAREGRDLGRLIRQAIAEIDAGRPALIATRRVYGRLAEIAGNRFLSSMLADVEIAIERNLAQAGSDEPSRAHVRETLQHLRTAIEHGDGDAARDAASRQYSVPPADPGRG